MKILILIDINVGSRLQILLFCCCHKFRAVSALKKIHVVFGFVLNDNERLTVVCIFVFQNTEFKHIIFEYSILHWAEAYLLYLWDVIVPVSILKRKMEPILKLKIVCSSKKEGVEKLIYVYRRIHWLIF